MQQRRATIATGQKYIFVRSDGKTTNSSDVLCQLINNFYRIRDSDYRLFMRQRYHAKLLVLSVSVSRDSNDPISLSISCFAPHKSWLLHTATWQFFL